MTFRIRFPASVSGALFLGLATMAAPAMSANLLTNGSFESPNVPADVYLGAGSAGITGWTVALLPGSTPGALISFQDNAAYCGLGVCASDGTQMLDLTGVVGRGGGVVSNGFATLAGATYDVSFDVGAFFVSGQGSFGDATVVLTIDGTQVGSFTNTMSLSGPGSDWQRFSYSFLGTGNAMAVGLFASLATTSSNLGVGLDNVAVEQRSAPGVPEPASWALMIGGFAIAGAAMRRRAATTVRFA